MIFFFFISSSSVWEEWEVCVSVCVCERERERESERVQGKRCVLILEMWKEKRRASLLCNRPDSTAHDLLCTSEHFFTLAGEF